MSRKFSDISGSTDIGLVKLIESKISKFESRFERETDPMVLAFYNAMQFILIPQVRNIDSATIQMFELLKANPDVNMDSSIEGLWNFCSERYTGLFVSIRGFNEAGPGVNDILNSSEWLNFQKNIKSQIHEFDPYQSRFSEKFEKINELETRTYTLLSLIKSAIIESKGTPKRFDMPEGFKEAKDIADSLVKNKGLIESGIESSKSIQTFNVNNTHEALKNVGEMFYNKDTYVPFQNSNWTWASFFNFIKQNVLETIFLIFGDYFTSPKWWLFFGLVPLVGMLYLLGVEYNLILKGDDNDLKKYKDYWQILVSTHIIFVSFVGYIIVFCFGNYRKLENRMENYKFRSILTKSFGYLIQSADEEQKKILYPKALDAIFKDLPETNSGQDVNINLPVTEIMKGITGK